jgi:ubiquinone/menaquinone biosynthesis C-methylase UbiE
VTSTERRYVPAAGRAGLTGIYDRAVALTMRERRWRPRLRDRIAARLAPGGRVVDVGAGNGTLAIALAALRPDVEVIAVDGDLEVLRLAQRRPGAERVTWRQGLAGTLELEDANADAVVMSLLLHHLDLGTKRRALADARRVLGPDGWLHVADWGRPQDPAMRAAFAVLQLIDGREETRDHAAGRLPGFLTEAGFPDVERYGRLRTGWGSLELLEARARGGGP